MAFVESLTNYVMMHKWVFLVYLIIAILIYFNRKKLIIEGKVFFLYKTQHGVDYINKVADKHKEFIKLLGFIAIGVGFVGMLLICGVFVWGIYNLIFVPDAPPTVSLVIPGVKIPGSPFVVPLGYGLLALFIVILIHEFGHGIVAKAHGIPIKSTGVGLLLFLPLAFVEPDEKKLLKEKSSVQQSMFAAGPFMNMALAVIAFLLISFVFYPLVDPDNPNSAAIGNPNYMTMVERAGFRFNDLKEGLPAEKYGLEAGVTYTTYNGKRITNAYDLRYELQLTRSNETIVIGNPEKQITIVTDQNPVDGRMAYLGVGSLETVYEMKNDGAIYKALYHVLKFLAELFKWIFILSFGIGLANLLPLGPVDGGRMLYTAIVDSNGKDKGAKIASKITMITLIVLLLLLFVPIIKSLIF